MQGPALSHMVWCLLPFKTTVNLARVAGNMRDARVEMSHGGACVLYKASRLETHQELLARKAEVDAGVRPQGCLAQQPRLTAVQLEWRAQRGCIAACLLCQEAHLETNNITSCIAWEAFPTQGCTYHTCKSLPLAKIGEGEVMQEASCVQGAIIYILTGIHDVLQLKRTAGCLCMLFIPHALL